MTRMRYSHVWFRFALTAEWHVRGELTAYEKMEVAQGTNTTFCDLTIQHLVQVSAA